jgi:two-component system, response regulator YesN
MYNVLIVDDDVDTLEFISKLLPWETYGYTVVGKAFNGEEALFIMNDKSIDLLITDITMPRMDGLELIRNVNRISPTTKSIILTCHEEFSDAKEAISLGVYDYVVKYTVEEQQFINILEKITLRLQENSKLERLEEKVQSNKTIITQSLLNRIDNCDGNGYKIIQKELNELCFMYKNPFEVVFIYTRDSNMKLSMLKSLVDPIIENELGCVSYEYHDNYLVYFVDTIVYGDIKRMNTCNKIKNQIIGNTNALITIIISEVQDDIQQLANTLEQLLLSRYEVFYSSKSEIINMPAITKVIASESLDFRKMHQTIQSEQFNLIMEEINKQFSFFEKNHTHGQIVEQFYMNLVKELQLILYYKNIQDKPKLHRANSCSGYLNFSRKAILEFNKEIKDVFSHKYRGEIATVLTYMETHLNENITCDAMARIVNMNESYFSKLFKKEVEVSFSNYLMKMRIERATYLLINTELSMQTITDQIGLTNMHYFYRLFKKETGQTPGETRNRVI